MDQHGQSLHDGSGDGFALGDVGGCVPEVDGALLMELLEDTPSDQPPEDVDRLSLVIRSLEAELGCGSASAAVGVDGAESMTAGTPSDDGYGGLEDVLSELDGTGRCAAAEAAAMEYYWPEAPVVVASHDMGGWYVDGEGYEMRDQFVQYYYADGSVEQVYSPLWE